MPEQKQKKERPPLQQPKMRIDVLKVTIEHCPRCGDQHDELEIKRFARAGADQRDRYDGPKASWEYWAECPLETEPILFNVAVETEMVPS